MEQKRILIKTFCFKKNLVCAQEYQKKKEKTKMKASRSIVFGDPTLHHGVTERLQCPYGSHITNIRGHYGLIGPYRNKETILDVCITCSDGTEVQASFPEPLLTHDKVSKKKRKNI